MSHLGAYRGRSAAAPLIVAPPPQPVTEPVAGQGVLDLDGLETVAPAPSANGNGAPGHDGLRPEMSTTTLGPTSLDAAERVMLLRPRVEERVIRRVRLAPVFRMALGLLVCGYIVTVGALVALWWGAEALDMIGGIEGFVEDLGFENFEFYPDAMLRAVAIGGAILVVAGTVFAVLAAEVFNLLTVMTGGLRAVVGPPPAKKHRVRGAWRRITRRA